MIALRLAAGIAATVTIILNAHAGFISSKELEYALLFAALNAALDVGKCAMLVAASVAARQRAYLLALLCLLLFVPLFVNSVWNAVSQVAITRDHGKADQAAAAEQRSRNEAAYARLSAELALLRSNPTYEATAACTLPKSKDGRTFCEKMKATSDALSATTISLNSSSPTDPEPHITLMAALLGTSAPPIRFTAALMPVLLAEVLGSFGFYIAARIRAEASQTPVGGVLRNLRSGWRRRRETLPVTPAEASGPLSPTQPQPQRSGPVWSGAIRTTSPARSNL